jgi:hypothetical protein
VEGHVSDRNKLLILIGAALEPYVALVPVEVAEHLADTVTHLADAIIEAGWQPPLHDLADPGRPDS